MAGKATYTVHVVKGRERRVWCDRCMVSEIEVEVLMMTSDGFRRVGTYQDCDKAKAAD